MFYAVLALANLKGIPTRKHQGALSFFDREFIRTGVFPKEISAALHKAFDLRLEIDYADLSEPTCEEASTAIERAASFVAAVEVYLGPQLQE